MAFIKITDKLSYDHKKIINTDMICCIERFSPSCYYYVYLSGNNQYVGVDNIEIKKIFNVIGESLD